MKTEESGIDKKEYKTFKALDNYEIVVSNPRMYEIFKQAEMIASKPINVLITGDSGVGKEELAKFIHAQSTRAANKFVSVNIAALPESLIETELFGHVKGAYTGAIHDKDGMFKIAHGGTIFLDEIGELSLAGQSKILKVIDNRLLNMDREFIPVGGEKAIKSNFRVIAASNRCLEQMKEEKKFRGDLYYRLNVVRFHIPPLCERKEDIRALTIHFRNIISKELRASVPVIKKEVWDFFHDYSWPGNVRQLQNVIVRILVFREKDEDVDMETVKRILPDLFTLNGWSKIDTDKEVLTYQKKVENFQKELIKDALEENSWVGHRAARTLGMTPGNLRYLCRKFCI